MKQEHKELLLKDLCSRLPYRVKLRCYSNSIMCVGPYTLDTITLDRIFNKHTEYVPTIDEVKPYLFPMSSMTEEQKEEYRSLQQKVNNSKGLINSDVMEYVNWCYKNHIDINNLIPLGLAIDATGLNIY